MENYLDRGVPLIDTVIELVIFQWGKTMSTMEVRGRGEIARISISYDEVCRKSL